MCPDDRLLLRDMQLYRQNWTRGLTKAELLRETPEIWPVYFSEDVPRDGNENNLKKTNKRQTTLSFCSDIKRTLKNRSRTSRDSKPLQHCLSCVNQVSLNLYMLHPRADFVQEPLSIWLCSSFAVFLCNRVSCLYHSETGILAARQWTDFNFCLLRQN